MHALSKKCGLNPPPKQRRRRKVTPHQWQWSALKQRWVCQSCQHTSTSKATAIACRGKMAPSCAYHKQPHASHVVHELDKEGPDRLLFCDKCGHYAAGRMAKLAKPCKRIVQPCTPQWYPLERLRRGAHPVTGTFWCNPSRWFGPFLHGHATATVSASCVPAAQHTDAAPPSPAAVQAPAAQAPAAMAVGGYSGFDDPDANFFEEEVADFFEEEVCPFFGPDASSPRYP